MFYSPSNTNNKRQLCFAGNVIISPGSRLPGQPNFVPFLQSVLLNILLGAFENILAFLVKICLLLDGRSESSFPACISPFAVFQHGLGHRREALCRLGLGLLFLGFFLRLLAKTTSKLW